MLKILKLFLSLKMQINDLRNLMNMIRYNDLY